MKSLEQPGNLPPSYKRQMDSVELEIRKLWAAQNRGDTSRRYDKTFANHGPVYVSESGPWYPPNFGGRLVAIVVGLKTAGTTNTVVKVRVNNADVPGGTITVPAGQTKVLSQSIDEFLSGDSDFITVGVTTAGSGARSITVQTRWIMV